MYTKLASKNSTLKFYRSKRNSLIQCPFFQAKLSAGFPSPADGYLEKTLDLNDLLIEHPNATFFVRVQGDSMKDCGILSGDILIVDRSLEVKNNDVVVALVNAEFTVKRIRFANKRVFLFPENKEYSCMEITEDMDFRVWGVVSNVIHSFR